jgi:hypothetical protein
MEDRVDVYGGGKLELVSIFAYIRDNWEWAITLVVQFP